MPAIKNKIYDTLGVGIILTNLCPLQLSIVKFTRT